LLEHGRGADGRPATAFSSCPVIQHNHFAMLPWAAEIGPADGRRHAPLWAQNFDGQQQLGNLKQKGK
jgi:hypothetical protein